MSLRTKLAQNPALAAILPVVLLLIAAGVAWINMAPAQPPAIGSKVWYFDPAAKSLMIVPAGEPPADRPELVRARVFSTGSCEDESQRLMYLEKTSRPADLGPEGLERPGSARGRPEGPPRAVRLVAAQDSPDRWVDAASTQGQSITGFAGKVGEGAKPTECYPDPD